MAVYDIPAYTEQPSVLAGVKTIPRNPTLPQTPLGAATDAQFEALDAQLKSEYQRKYADLIRSIGYVDPKTGQIIKGDIETNADAQRAQLRHDMFYAGIDTINQSQNEGNYFSGYQANRFARSQYPYTTQLAGLDVSVARGLQDAQEQAANALRDYILQRNLGLADAAARQADLARNTQGTPDATNPGAGPDHSPNTGPPHGTADQIAGTAQPVVPPQAFFGDIPPPVVPPQAYFGPLKTKDPNVIPPGAMF